MPLGDPLGQGQFILIDTKLIGPDLVTGKLLQSLADLLRDHILNILGTGMRQFAGIDTSDVLDQLDEAADVFYQDVIAGDHHLLLLGRCWCRRLWLLFVLELL
jgi:hypothetical protein